MLKFETLQIKNFMSIGNIQQNINFNNNEVALVIGENKDISGEGNRNGAGKSSIINALCYVLYGTAISNIKKDNLINKTNGKQMLVSLSFSKNGKQYKIERGRKPAVLKFLINNEEQIGDDDEAQGENRLTQLEIENVIGIEYEIFKQIVSLNATGEPFLNLKISDQKNIIEFILGITKLSEKAAILKRKMDEVKSILHDEEIKFESIKRGNNIIRNNINSLTVMSDKFNNEKLLKMDAIQKQIDELNSINVDLELIKFEETKKYTENEKHKKEIISAISIIENDIIKLNKQIEVAYKNIGELDKKQCPTCEQSINDKKHRALLHSQLDALYVATEEKDKKENEKTVLADALTAANSTTFNYTSTAFSNIHEIYSIKSKIENLNNTLDSVSNSTNTYNDQISVLTNSALQVEDPSTMNAYADMLSHQEFLYKLLTNKDSYVRKKLIDQNLSYLNVRLAHYLDALQLPHSVMFMNDMTVDISYYKQELDFDNLSRGEKTRLSIGLSLAFRDVYENLNGKINLLCIDELIDNGLDTSGAANAFKLFEKIALESSKNIFLISHKEELLGEAHKIIKVVKEDGFTTIEEI